MDNGDWPDEKYETVRLTGLRLDRERVLAEGDGFPLTGQPVLDQQRSYRRSDYVRLPHISDPEQQVVLSVSFADDRLVTEHYRLRSSFRARNLREYDAGDQRLDEKADAGLHHHDENCESAFWLDDPESVANRCLSFYAEQKSRRVVVHVINASLPRVVVYIHVILMNDGDDEPDQSERAPGDDERRRKQDQMVAPLHVDQRRENIHQIFLFPFHDVTTGDVTFAGLENKPTFLPTGNELSNLPCNGIYVINADRKCGRRSTSLKFTGSWICFNHGAVLFSIILQLIHPFRNWRRWGYIRYSHYLSENQFNQFSICPWIFILFVLEFKIHIYVCRLQCTYVFI